MLYILLVVLVPSLSIITVSCNVVAANYTNNNAHNRDGSQLIEQRRRHLTNDINNNRGNNLTTFIVGGTETTKGDFPFLVSIGNSGRRGGHGT